MINAGVVRSGMYGAIGAAYNLEITPRGRALTPEQPGQTKPMPMKEGESVKLVARIGECFEATFQRKEVAHNRDGVFYLFHLNDLTDKHRGERLVSVFRFGSEQFYGPNYDARLEPVLLNTIRRAFDSGRLTFDGPYDPHTYTEILLQPEDFRPQKAASGSEVQDLIRHEAYWLGFRHNPSPGYPIQFDSPTDLEYLGVPPADVRRYVLLMGQRGLLEKIMEGLGRPTHRLIDAYESEIAQKQPARPNENAEQWDVFISHATEDKDYVEPLVKALEKAGIRVWFDKSTGEWGDDLRSSIDRGLANCRYGIVVFSKAFLKKKKWTEYEFNSLFALEQPGRKIILPIWHGITREDLLQYGAGFADRLAKISSKDSYDEIVESLLGLLGRPKPEKTNVSEAKVSGGSEPAQPKPNAVAYAWYELPGEEGPKAKAFIRPSTRRDGLFTFENSFGEQAEGTKEEIAVRFSAFDKSIRLKHYVRMQHASSDPVFSLN